MKGAKQLAMVKQAQANAELHIGVLPRQGAVFMDLMDFRLTLTPFEARAVAGCLMEKADSAERALTLDITAMEEEESV